MPLSHVQYGSGSPLIILHGLFGSARNWASIAKQLSKNHHVYAIDLRNHGSSFWDDTMAYEDMAADVQQFIARQGLVNANIIGHSMGGKVAMTLALSQPRRVRKLVVVDIAPVEYEPHFDGYLTVMRGLPLGDIKRRSDADEHLATVIPDRMVRAFLLQNLNIEPDGASWRINLAAIDEAMEQIRKFPDFSGHQPFRQPTLFVAGATSTYIKPGHNAVIRGLFPNAAVNIIQGAGHWVHAEQPDSFLNAVGTFLAAPQ